MYWIVYNSLLIINQQGWIGHTAHFGVPPISGTPPHFFWERSPRWPHPRASRNILLAVGIDAVDIHLPALCCHRHRHRATSDQRNLQGLVLVLWKLLPALGSASANEMGGPKMGVPQNPIKWMVHHKGKSGNNMHDDLKDPYSRKPLNGKMIRNKMASWDSTLWENPIPQKKSRHVVRLSPPPWRLQVTTNAAWRCPKMQLPGIPSHPKLDHFSIEIELKAIVFWGSPIFKKPPNRKMIVNKTVSLGCYVAGQPHTLHILHLPILPTLSCQMEIQTRKNAKLALLKSRIEISLVLRIEHHHFWDVMRCDIPNWTVCPNWVHQIPVVYHVIKLAILGTPELSGSWEAMKSPKIWFAIHVLHSPWYQPENSMEFVMSAASVRTTDSLLNKHALEWSRWCSFFLGEVPFKVVPPQL